MKNVNTLWAITSFALLLAVGCSKDDEPKSTPAKFSVDQSSIDFNEVKIGALKNVKVVVTNSGEENLVLNDFTISGANASEFSVNAGETDETVQADGTFEFVASFIPTEEGSKTATLTITSNVGEHKVSLLGKGTPEPVAIFGIDPESKDYGDVEVRTEESQIFTITNTGDADLSIMSYSMDGSTESFQVNFTSQTIVPGGTYDLEVTFEPQNSGNKTATLSMATNVGDFTIDLQGNGIVIDAIVSIPDANFKAELLAHGDSVTGENIDKIDTNGDGEIQLSEAESYNGTLLCYESDINDLTGIEAFINLTVLIIEDTPLTSIDLSNNTALVRLDVSNNSLTSLDISNNIALERLECGNNQLTALDVSPNTALTYLSCNSNSINVLDVSQNIALEQLNCSYNQLSNLDVSQNTALTSLNCRINKLTQLDVSQNTSLQYLYAHNNQLTLLDVSKNTALKDVRCSNNQLTALDISQNTALEKLICDENQLTALDVSMNLVLKELFCNDNQLTNINVSQNTALEFLSCNFNQLSDLDVSQNTVLEYLACTDNQLSNLNVSGNTVLASLFCFKNQLNSLNVANGNNSAMRYIKAQNNPGLTCIKIDGDGFMPPSSWSKDDTASYAIDCP